MYSKVIIMGRLTADPELRQTKEGTPVASFRVAVNRPPSKTGERVADFFAVTAWRSRADFVAKFFKKGNVILVDGTLTTREYVDARGINQRVVEITAENISFTGEPRKEVSQTPGTGDFVDVEIVDNEEDLPF
jgi:single-strand DNA-binding protein